MNIDLSSPRDPAVVPDEWWLERMRRRRDQMLRDSDWTQLPDVPVSSAAWATYRQELRDAPETWTPGPTWDAPDAPA